MATEAKYKKNELKLIFTDEHWEVWKSVMLFRNLYRIRYDLNITDRDRGTIEEVYSEMKEAGVDFDKYQGEYPTVEQIGVKDSLLEIQKELKEVNKRLSKIQPTLLIRYENKEKL